jgi:hypothetical protein
VLPPRFPDRPNAGAATGQGRALGVAAQRQTLDGTHVSAGHNRSGNRAPDFAEARRVVSLEMVLSRYGVRDQLKDEGSRLTGCCPIHKGSNPKQFVAHPASNTWHCFSPECNRGGGTIEFVSLRENCGIKHAAALIADWFALSPPPPQQQRRRTGMNNAPSHKAFVVEDREPNNEQSGFWTRCGSAWPHKDGKGLNIQITPGLAVSGRLVLREYTADDEAIDNKKAKRSK